MLQNVHDMSQAFRELIDAGYPVNLTAIPRLSVYPYGHVRRNGEYDMDVNDFLLPIAEDILTTLLERTTQLEPVSVSKLIYSKLAQ